MFVDIHTHLDNQSVIKIVDEFSEEKILKTWGIHPWEVDVIANEVPRDLRSLGMTEAIGEVGLDKVHKETFEKQIDVFGEMIRLSETLKKPVIVHCVRAYSEIIEMRKKTQATMPWVIHGFNSSVETMRQLLRYDIYISLGEILYRNENQAVEILKNIPLDRLFLETDVSGRDISDVYAKAASLMGCEIGFLCKQIFENYGRLEATH
ncbi:MAG: TatD family hydrolase [Bacteroidales bacterium]|nr:TatD family hydrolase [Bacteroidales bacterium]